jgi:hypothetical protein
MKKDISTAIIAVIQYHYLHNAPHAKQMAVVSISEVSEHNKLSKFLKLFFLTLA